MSGGSVGPVGRGRVRIDVPAEVLPARLGLPVRVPLTVRNENDGERPVLLRLVGALAGLLPARTLDLPAHSAVDLEMEVPVPAGLPPGRHGLLVEVLDRADGAVLADAEVSLVVEHTAGATIYVSPAMLTRRTGGRCRVVVRNNDEVPIRLALSVAPDTPGPRMRIERPEVEVPPGGSVRLKARMRQRPFLLGPERIHWFTIVGSGAGSPVYARTSLRQPPVVARLVTGLAMLTALVAAWAALTLGAVRLLDSVSSESAAGAEEDGADGADGDAGADGGAAGEDGAGGEGGEAAAGVSVSGTVTATPDGSGVSVSWRPVRLGDGKATPVAAADTAVAAQRTSTDADGAFEVAGLDPVGLYEFAFAKPGHQTVTRIVQLAGDPAVLEIVLVAGEGVVAGRTVGPDGSPLGGVTLRLTDGAVVYGGSTPSTGDSVGSFAFTDLSTPGTYTLEARVAGRGLASTIVDLPAGGSATGLTLVLSPDVGAFSGRIDTSAFEAATAVATLADEDDGSEPAGGSTVPVSITATDGTITRSTTSVTSGELAGSFSIEQLPLGRTYTITYAAEGWAPLTEQVELTASTSAEPRSISLRRATGRLTGTVTVEGGVIPPSDVAVTVLNPDRAYKSTDAITSAGELLLDGLEPGRYVAVFEGIGVVDQVLEVDVVAGLATSVDVTLAAAATGGGLGSAAFTFVDDDTDAPLDADVRVRFRRDGDCGSVGGDATSCAWTATAGSLTLAGLPAGTYVVEAGLEGYAGQLLTVTVPPGTDLPAREVRLVSRGSMQGLVQDDAGGALQGVKVSLFDVAGGLVEEVVSGTNGQFQLVRVLNAAEYTVRVEATGFETVERVVGGALRATVNIDTTLRSKAQVTGEVRVLDTATGTFREVGRDEFTVFLDIPGDDPDAGWIDTAGRLLIRQLGSYRLALEPLEEDGASYRICVVLKDDAGVADPGRCDAPDDGVRISTGLDPVNGQILVRSVYLSPAPGSVTGRVMAGGPVAGARVQLRRVGPDGRVFETAEILSAADGRFTFTSVTPTTTAPGSAVFYDPSRSAGPDNPNACLDTTCWYVLVSTPSDGSDTVEHIRMGPGDALDVGDLNLVTSPAELSVTLVGDDGSPVDGVEVAIASSGSTAVPPKRTVDGNVRFVDLATGVWTVSVDPAGEVVRPFEFELTLSNGEVEDVLLSVARPLGSLVVRVDDGAGGGLAGATVTAERGGTTVGCTDASGATAVTDADGLCTIRDLEPGVVTVRASRTGYGAATTVASVLAGRTTAVPVVLAPSGGLTVTAVDAGGAPVPGASATVFDASGRRSVCTTVAGTGACTLTGLAVGTAWVEVGAAGYATTTTTATVTVGATASVPVALPTDVGSLRVSVVDAAGATVTGATVAVVGGASCTDGGLGDASADGTCVVTGVPAGPAALTVSRSGYVTGYASVTVAYATETRVTVSLGADTGRLAVRVVDPDGAAVEGVAIDVVDGASATDSCTDGAGGDDADGRCTFEGLAPGLARVSVTDPSGVHVAASAEAGVDRGGNGAVTVVLARATGALTVEVIDTDGAPVAGASVVVFDATGRRSACAAVDLSGRCALTGLAVGVATVEVTDPSGGHRRLTTTATVSASATTDVEAVLTRVEASLSGTVTSSGSGVAGAVVAATRDGVTLTAVTDGTGRYAFAGLAAGDWSVVVLAPGYVTSAPVTGTVPVAGGVAGVDVDLVEQTGGIALTVVTAAGVPVTGMAVSVDGGTAALTDADGNLRVTGLAAAVFPVVLTDPSDRYLGQSLQVRVERGRTTDVRVVVAGARSEIRLALETSPAAHLPGTPAAAGGLAVQLQDPDGAVVATATAATVGTRRLAVFQDVVAGEYTLVVVDPDGTADLVVDGVTYDAPAAVAVSVDGRTDLDAGTVRLVAATVAVTVSVTDGGTPLAGASVVLSGPNLASPRRATSAGADPVADLGAVPPGPYRLEVTASGYAPVVADVVVADRSTGGAAQELAQDLTADPVDGALEVTVTRGGSAAAGAVVAVAGTGRTCVTASSTGTCTVPGLAAGTYTVSASLAGLEPVEQSVTVTAGPAATTLSVAFAAPATTAEVTVVARDAATGAVLDDVTVTTVGGGAFCTADTDASGTCSATGVAAGPLTLQASADGYDDGFAATTITAGIPATVTVFLRPAAATAGAVTVVVLDASDGSPVAGATVTSGGVAFCAAVTDADGRCSPSSGVADGALVEVAASGYVTGYGSVTVVGGRPAVLAVALAPVAPTTGTLVVSVVDASDGSAVAGATVTVPGCTAVTGGYTCPAGSVEVSAAKAGEYRTGTGVAVVAAGSSTTLVLRLVPVGSIEVTLLTEATASMVFRVVGTDLRCTVPVGGTSCSIAGVPVGTWDVAELGSGWTTVDIGKAGATVAVTW